MIEGVDHIAIAVEDLDKAIELFERVFGLELKERETIPARLVEAATFELGGTCIELVEGTGPDSPITKYVEKNGPGIHHIALQVQDIEKALEELKSKSVQMINEEAVEGKSKSRIAFIHPKSTQKILFELVQPGTPPGK